MHANFKFLLEKHIGQILLTVAITVAFFSFRGYGISYDEPQQRLTAEINYNYIFNQDSTLLKWDDRDYGVAFELPLLIIEKALNIEDSRTKYYLRHLLTHLLFLIGAYCFFLTVDLIYKNKWLASLAFLLLLTHPRIYSHSFFNSKDLPFLSMFCISILFLIKAIEKKEYWRYCLLGVFIGLLINIRIVGLILPFFVLLTLLLEGIQSKTASPFFIKGFLLILFSGISLYVTWPFLWNNPLDSFLTALDNMSHFRWNALVLFNGESIPAENLDWTYIPTWFVITTPLVILVAGLFGIFVLLNGFILQKNIFHTNKIEAYSLLFLVLFLSPYVAILTLNSIVYDSWRQLFFIYPFFILIGIYGIHFVLSNSRKWYKLFAIALILISTLNCIRFMYIHYPIQYIYFNSLISYDEDANLLKKYELDYWGLSYKEALKYILDHDNALKIKVSLANVSGINNIEILNKEERARIQVVPLEEAEYFVSNYRWQPNGYPHLKDKEFQSIKIEGTTISQIFKLKE